MISERDTIRNALLVNIQFYDYDERLDKMLAVMDDSCYYSYPLSRLLPYVVFVEAATALKQDDVRYRELCRNPLMCKFAIDIDHQELALEISNTAHELAKYRRMRVERALKLHTADDTVGLISSYIDYDMI